MPEDVIVFPVIGWSFLRQRPQQIAIELGRRGRRVFYLAETFAPADLPRPYLFWGSPADNVHLVQLRCPEPHPDIYKAPPTPAQAAALTEAIAALRRNCAITASVSIVDLPFWRGVAQAQPQNAVVYDCMDHHAGFKHNDRRMLDEEDRLIREADLVITTSAALLERIAPARPAVLIRNGCEAAHFRRRPGVSARRFGKQPVVGYFGSLDHWFDTALVARAARAYRDWRFVLVGRRQDCDLDALQRLPNVRIVGETPYAMLPEFAHDFDVCMIPFLVNELTLHTNPVKMYEYLAAGKPVVGTALPEIMIGGEGLVHVAKDSDEFIAKLADAMAGHNDAALVERRVAYAMKQTWSDRVDCLEGALAGLAHARRPHA